MSVRSSVQAAALAMHSGQDTPHWFTRGLKDPSPCVRLAAEANEEFGLSITGRGFDVSVAVPFDQPLSEGLRAAARRCAEACPTGAISLRTARSCDLASCGSCPLLPT